MCCLSSTVLEEEKAQQEERMRMESRRQATVSWDSGGADEAPPKVAQGPAPYGNHLLLTWGVSGRWGVIVSNLGGLWVWHWLP